MSGRSKRLDLAGGAASIPGKGEPRGQTPSPMSLRSARAGQTPERTSPSARSLLPSTPRTGSPVLT